MVKELGGHDSGPVSSFFLAEGNGKERDVSFHKHLMYRHDLSGSLAIIPLLWQLHSEVEPVTRRRNARMTIWIRLPPCLRKSLLIN